MQRLRKNQFQLSEQQERARYLLIEQLKKDPLVHRFIQSHNLPLHIVEKNASLFAAYTETIRKCQGCQGIQMCAQPIPGRFQSLDVDEQGFLCDIYKPCKYEKMKQKQYGHQKRYKIFYGSPSNFLIDFEKIDLTEESDEYTQSYMALIDSLDTEKGIYLYGKPGAGKTYLLWAVANRMAKEGKTISLVHIPSCIQEIKQNIQDSQFRNQMISKMKFCDVLIADDIGSESISPWTRDEILFPILEYRMNNHLKTYFSSNYTLLELEDQYASLNEVNSRVASQRFMERIKSASLPCQLIGDSRR